MTQHYSDPDRESDPFALPDLEIEWFAAGELGLAGEEDANGEAEGQRTPLALSAPEHASDLSSASQGLRAAAERARSPLWEQAAVYSADARDRANSLAGICDALAGLLDATADAIQPPEAMPDPTTTFDALGIFGAEPMADLATDAALTDLAAAGRALEAAMWSTIRDAYAGARNAE